MAFERDDPRWDAKLKRRVARLFRSHVARRNNPKGRIVRRECVYWGGVQVGRHRIAQPARCIGDPAQGHHVDYDQPFLVAWLCRNCHAAVHCGTLKFYASMLMDYTSLVAPVLRARAGKGLRSRPDRQEQLPFKGESPPF